MATLQQSNTSLWSGASIAFLGFLYCLFESLKIEQGFCTTVGCSLYQQVDVNGFSLWWLGTFVFALIVIFCIFRKYALVKFIAGLALFGDCFLLLFMVLTAPCVACLGVAVFFALLYFTLLKVKYRGREENKRSYLLLIWLILFIAALLLIFREKTEPSPMVGADNAVVKLYFSPSCPSCLEAVEKMDTGYSVAYYPIAKSIQDVKIIFTMQENLFKGMTPSRALTLAINEPVSSLPKNLRTVVLLWQLLRNKIVVILYGSGNIPLIIWQGLPSVLENKNFEQSAATVQSIDLKNNQKNKLNVANGSGGPENKSDANSLFEEKPQICSSLNAKGCSN